MSVHSVAALAVGDFEMKIDDEILHEKALSLQRIWAQTANAASVHRELPFGTKRVVAAIDCDFGAYFGASIRF